MLTNDVVSKAVHMSFSASPFTHADAWPQIPDAHSPEATSSSLEFATSALQIELTPKSLRLRTSKSYKRNSRKSMGVKSPKLLGRTPSSSLVRSSYPIESVTVTQSAYFLPKSLPHPPLIVLASLV